MPTSPIYRAHWGPMVWPPAQLGKPAKHGSQSSYHRSQCLQEQMRLDPWLTKQLQQRMRSVPGRFDRHGRPFADRKGDCRSLTTTLIADQQRKEFTPFEQRITCRWLFQRWLARQLFCPLATHSGFERCSRSLSFPGSSCKRCIWSIQASWASSLCRRSHSTQAPFTTLGSSPISGRPSPEYHVQPAGWHESWPVQTLPSTLLLPGFPMSRL